MAVGWKGGRMSTTFESFVWLWLIVMAAMCTAGTLHVAAHAFSGIAHSMRCRIAARRRRNQRQRNAAMVEREAIERLKDAA